MICYDNAEDEIEIKIEINYDIQDGAIILIIFNTYFWKY